MSQAANAKLMTLPEVTLAEAVPALDFEQVYAQHFAFVWRSARSLGVPASALDDVTQDVFVVVHRKLAEFEGRSAVRTWLARILLRVVSEHRRRFRRKEGTHAPLADDAHASAGPTPHDSAARQEAVRLLEQILGEMDEERRTVFVLAEIEQMPVPEIAEALSVNLNTVYSRLRLARRDYEKAVERVRARDSWRRT